MFAHTSPEIATQTHAEDVATAACRRSQRRFGRRARYGRPLMSFEPIDGSRVMPYDR
jgi:hypothetical protein